MCGRLSLDVHVVNYLKIMSRPLAANRFLAVGFMICFFSIEAMCGYKCYTALVLLTAECIPGRDDENNHKSPSI